MNLPFKCWLCFVLCAVALVVLAEPTDKYQPKRLSYINALLQQDTQGITKLFNENGELLVQANPTFKQPTNIAAYFTSLFERFVPLAYTREPFYWLDMADKTAELGHYHLQLRNTKSTVHSIKGSYMTIWNNGLSETPSIDTELWNFDHNVDFVEELKFKNVPSVVTAFEPHLPINSAENIELAAYSALIKDAVLLRDNVILTQLYAPDGIILRNSNSPILGFEDIDAYWQKHAQEIASMEGLQQRTTKIEELGNFLIQHSSHIAVWRSGEYSGVNTGKHIRIWERQQDGRIKVRVLASAYDM